MGTEEDKQLFYQHDCHWVYDHVTLNNPDFGKIAVFNNRVPSAGGGAHSAVHLLNPSYTDYDNNFMTDFDNGTYLPADFDWSYMAPDSIYTSGYRRSSDSKTATASFVTAAGATPAKSPPTVIWPGGTRHHW